MATGTQLHKDLVWEVVSDTIKHSAENGRIGVATQLTNEQLDLVSRTFNVYYNNHFIHPNLNMIGNKYNIGDDVFVIYNNNITQTKIKRVIMIMDEHDGFSIYYRLKDAAGKFVEGSLYDSYDELINGMKIDWTNKNNRRRNYGN